MWLRLFSFIAFSFFLSVQGAASAPKPASLMETDALRQAVAQGQLPPVDQRVPSSPLVVDLKSQNKDVGRSGGTLRTLGGQPKDTRLMVIYGYARLIGYTEKFQLEPDIAEKIDVQDGRIFTFHLRPGHRWSDGAPFTSEDFRYFWQDVASNKELSALGIPPALLVDGERPKVEILDDVTVRYSWSKPNPFFLPALAAAQPLYIYRPAHYLKQFHAKYAQPQKIQQMVSTSGQRNWVGLHYKHDRPYKNNLPDRPSLQPWVLKTPPPSERFEFVRNPYFHRIDEYGQQLPYIDRVVMTIASSKLIAAKAGSGEVDLQARYLNFSNYTFLKQGEKRSNFTVRRWLASRGSQMALYPNLNVKDKVWRAVVRKADFRRALSLSINRHDINLVVYYGLATEGNNTILPQSPLYKKKYSDKWAAYNPQKANELLDGLGLDQRNKDGIRLLPDGREVFIIVETAGEDSGQTDVLELIREDWQKIGVKLFIKPMQREVFRRRIFAGTTLMSVWTGLENAIPSATSSPDELAPTSQQQLQWPNWGLNFATNKRMGEAPDMAKAQDLLALNEAWKMAQSPQEQHDIWQRMLDIHADEVFSIGLISGVSQLIVTNNRLHNVPDKGIYSWNPGSFFGVYRPDTFWFSAPETGQGKTSP